MGHLLTSMALLLFAVMVIVAPATASSGWVHNPTCQPYPKYKALGEFAVSRYNEQNHGHLKFVRVEDCYVLDRGTGHYTYLFFTIVDGEEKYKTEVLEDLSAPGLPPVHNFGYFIPVAPPQPPTWQPNPTCQPSQKYKELGEFAVKRYNEQNHGNLKFQAVTGCSVLDRGTGHYTYRFITIVLGHGCEEVQNRSFGRSICSCYSPVHNFGYFHPLP